LRLIIDEKPVYVGLHCAVHNLNLLTNDVVSSVSKAIKFFTILQDACKFSW